MKDDRYWWVPLAMIAIACVLSWTRTLPRWLEVGEPMVTERRVTALERLVADQERRVDEITAAVGELQKRAHVPANAQPGGL